MLVIGHQESQALTVRRYKPNSIHTNCRYERRNAAAQRVKTLMSESRCRVLWCLSENGPLSLAERKGGRWECGEGFINPFFSTMKIRSNVSLLSWIQVLSQNDETKAQTRSVCESKGRPVLFCHTLSVDRLVSPAGSPAMMCAFLLILFSHLPSNQHFIFFSKFPHSHLIVDGSSAIQPRSHFPPDSCFNTSISNKKKDETASADGADSWERSIQVNYEELQSENRAAVVSNTNVSKVGGILWELFRPSHLGVWYCRLALFLTNVSVLTLWNWKKQAVVGC